MSFLSKDVINTSPEDYARVKETILKFSTQLLRHIPGKTVRGIIKDILGEIHDIQEERAIFITNQGRKLHGIIGNERHPTGKWQYYNDFVKGTPQAFRRIKQGVRNRARIASESGAK